MPRILLGLSIVNPPISGAAPKPLSSNMDSRSFLPTKTTSFASSNVYPLMVLKAPVPFGGGIKSKSVTSSLSVEGSLLKAGCFSFGSPVSYSSVINPMFDIKSTEYNNKVHSLKRECDQERPYLKECVVFHPLRQGINLTVQIQQSR